MIDIWLKESFGTPISWNGFGLIGTSCQDSNCLWLWFSWTFWIWQDLLDTKNANRPFFRLQIHTSISIPHLLSFLTKRLNNGESCKGQKRMSSSGTNTKKKAQKLEKRKMSVHCKSCEQMETSLLFSRPLFSICSHELWYSQRFLQHHPPSHQQQ